MAPKTITISVASVAAVVQAVHGLNENGQVLNVPNTDAFAAPVSAALTNAQSQMTVRTAMTDIAQAIRIDDETLSARYAEATSESEIRARDFLIRLETMHGTEVADAGDAEYDYDSTTGFSLSTCYANCHSACHGNRSWR